MDPSMTLQKVCDPNIPTGLNTGPTQVNDDWPGVFIRGDNALNYAMQLRSLLREQPGDTLHQMVLDDLCRVLESCHIANWPESASKPAVPESGNDD